MSDTGGTNTGPAVQEEGTAKIVVNAKKVR